MTGRSTSRSLLARVRTRDAEAWDELVHLYGPYVLQWCRRRVGNDDDVADVFQEVFQAVASRIDGFRKERDTDTFRGWLRTITRNKVHDLFRRRAQAPELTGGTAVQLQLDQAPAPEPEPTGTTETAEGDARAESRLFHRALGRVRGQFQEKTWCAFWRCVIDDQRPTDVADELQMSPGAVRVAKCRVLQRLREELGDL